MCSPTDRLFLFSGSDYSGWTLVWSSMVPFYFYLPYSLCSALYAYGSPRVRDCGSNLVGLCGFVSVGGRPEDPERLSVLYLLRLQCWGTWAGQLAPHHLHPAASISLAGLCGTPIYCTWLQLFWWYLDDLQGNLQPLHVWVGRRRGHNLPQGPVQESGHHSSWWDHRQKRTAHQHWDASGGEPVSKRLLLGFSRHWSLRRSSLC